MQKQIRRSAARRIDGQLLRSDRSAAIRFGPGGKGDHQFGIGGRIAQFQVAIENEKLGAGRAERLAFRFGRRFDGVRAWRGKLPRGMPLPLLLCETERLFFAIGQNYLATAAVIHELVILIRHIQLKSKIATLCN